MSHDNRLMRSLKSVERLPNFLQTWARSKAIGRVVKFVGTAGIRVVRLDRERGVFFLKNTPKVQNHIKGIHALATGLLVETASGLAVGCHLPDDKIPLLKSIHIQYRRVVQGDLTAVVALDPSIIESITTTERGSATIPVVVTDSSGNEPVECEIVWAWKLKG